MDFGIAFNASNSSDRVLHVEILSSEEFDCEGCGRKRKRVNFDNEIGDEAIHSDYLECPTVVKVETLDVNSAILAANSPFFYKLFNNGMRESHQRHFTLRIKACEEAPLMDLLNFICNNKMSATTELDLLDVLKVADKFEVFSCMRYCFLLLKELPMSLVDDLPSNALMAKARDLAPVYKLQDEAMALALPALELVLSSDDVQVKYEDDVYDFTVMWARAHYPKPEEYREILNKRLMPMMRFPHMTFWKLMEVLASPDLIDKEKVSRLVRKALFFKSGLPVDDINNPSTNLTERIYEYRPIKVVQLQFPDSPRCVVYFDLRKDECANLFPSKRLRSQPFYLGGKGFILIAKCKDLHFGLYVYMGNGTSNICILDYEFEVKNKSSKEFESKHKADNFPLIKGGKMVGKQNLLGIPWTDFIGDDSDYFIDGILHIRAELTLKN